MVRRSCVVVVAALIAASIASHIDAQGAALQPGTRVLLDAHNAYPENGRWANRIERALGTGIPLAIEQDLVWIRDPRTGTGHSVLSHGEPLTGNEPTLDEYFFTRIRPIVDDAFRKSSRADWPLVTLNLDFKTDEPEHHQAVWELLGRYESWLVTAPRTASPGEVAPLRLAPVLVLTGSADAQQRSFHDRIPPGGTLRLFGAVHPNSDGMPGAGTNYRRWVNYPWSAVEPEGQPAAGTWTATESERLTRLARAAHANGLWIRFYTLDGHAPGDMSNGWTPSYNFGSRDAAVVRWRAAIAAGVDFVAVDQYELFAEELRAASRPAGVTLEGTVTRGQYEQFIEHAFDVPSGAGEVDIELTFDDRERTVIDLGVRGAAAFRGWSGGGPQRVRIGTYSASYGYTPGPLERGRWAVVLGVPNIRPGVTTKYRLDIRFPDGSSHWPLLNPAAGWYVGDLHTHSGHSDGYTAGPGGARVKVPPHQVFDAASREGLDFVALTDHNTASHWVDVDRLQPSYPALLLLHAREITTYRGHLNAFGERRFVDFRLGAARTVAQLAGDLAAGGAWLSINHPALPDDERCMGCGWNDRDAGTIGQVQGVEVVNGNAYSEPLAGWRFWADLLNQGHRLVAIGGSDEHTPAEAADRRVGTPATVVYAGALSEAALLQGLQSGRVYVRTRGAGGPGLDLTATRGNTVFRMGDVASPGRLSLHVATTGAEGQQLEWIRKGSVVSSSRVPADGTASLVIDAVPGDWFSVILRDDAGPTVLSNAVYVR